MGQKSICVGCKVSFSNGTDFHTPKKEICPHCLGKLIVVNQKFKPPKKSDLAGWKLVAFMVENGFDFSSAYEEISAGVFSHVSYPKNLREADEFIKLYRKL